MSQASRGSEGSMRRGESPETGGHRVDVDSATFDPDVYFSALLKTKTVKQMLQEDDHLRKGTH